MPSVSLSRETAGSDHLMILKVKVTTCSVSLVCIYCNIPTASAAAGRTQLWDVKQFAGVFISAPQQQQCAHQDLQLSVWMNCSCWVVCTTSSFSLCTFWFCINEPDGLMESFTSLWLSVTSTNTLHGSYISLKSWYETMKPMWTYQRLQSEDFSSDIRHIIYLCVVNWTNRQTWRRQLEPLGK